MQYHTVEAIGPKRSLTPEGALLCCDVPIARTGLQLYGPGETPVTPGTADVVRIERDADEVFHPLTLASLHGKPVVNEHPTDEFGGRADVTPANWRQLAVGHVLNPRRGEGIDDDVMIADLMIWDPDAIDLINAGKRELSVGYDAQYDEIGPGHGRQRDIRANHVALVERGRCGPRCSIGDADLVGLTDDCECEEALAQARVEQSDPEEERAMRSKGTTIRERLRDILRARDAELENVLGAGEEEEPGGNQEHHVHVHLPGAPNGAGEEGDNPGVIAPASPAPSAPDQPPGGEPPAGGAAPADLPQAFAQHVAQNNAEHEELWNAIESLAGAGNGAQPQPNGGDAAYPHRDDRRRRDNIRPMDAADDNSRDELGEAPSATAGGTTVLPDFEMEAPPGTHQNDVRRARDSALFQDSFNETVANAEIIMPGIRLPTFDCAAKPQQTVPAIRKFRADVLDLAWRDPEAREIIEQFTGGHFTSAQRMTADTVKLLFKAVADAKARANRAAMSRGGFGFANGAATGSDIQTPRDLQKVLDAHYATQRPTR